MGIISKQRNIIIDWLRVIAVFFIVIAHIGINKHTFLFQFRTFDVVLIFFVTGLTYSQYGIKYESIFIYIRKRFMRLIVPALLFSLLYLILYNLSNFLFFGIDYSILNYTFETLTFIGGMGYIWVFLSLFSVSVFNKILTPYFMSKNKKYIYLFFILFFVVFQFIASRFEFDHFNTLYLILLYYVFMPIGLYFANLVGIVFLDLTKRQKIGLTLFLLVICLIYFISTREFNPDSYKYPPLYPYLSYGLLISVILFSMLKSLENSKFLTSTSKIIAYFSKNSLGIYLWHILGVSFMYFLTKIFGWNNFNVVYYIFSFIIILFIGIILNHLWNSLIYYLRKKLQRRQIYE